MNIPFIEPLLTTFEKYYNNGYLFYGLVILGLFSVYALIRVVFQ